MGSSLEDPFLYDCLPSLMPNSFKGFSDPHLIPLLDTEAFRRILSQQAMKNASEDTDQANAILRSITSPSTIENHSHMTLFCKPKIQRSEGMEEVECRPVILKENLPPNKNGQNQQARRHGSGRVSTRRPFKINLSSFGSNVNTERDPNIMQDVDEFWAAAERRETAEAIMRRMRGEKSPEHHCSQSLKTRVRRQGSGRTASSRDFVVKPKDYAEKYASSNLEKLEEGEYPVPTFISNSDQAGETATQIGTRPISKDSLHKKLMHGGHQDYCCETVKEMPPCEKDLPLDSIQQSDMQINDGEANGIHPNAVEQKEMSHVFEAEETVNMPPMNLLSSYQNSTERAAYLLLQDYLKLDVESMHKVPVSRSGLGFSDMGKSCLNGLQRDKLNAALSLSQTESSNTINSHSFFGDEAKAMALLQQFRKQIHSAVAETPPEIFQQKAAKASSSFTSTILPSNLSEALQWPRKPQSGVQAMLQDANKPSIQSMDEEVGAETPPENAQQKAAKECSPFTSPTPPSKLSAALKWLRKHEREVQPMSQNVNNPCLRNMDEERENPCTLSPSPNTNKPSIKNMDEKMINASTFSPSPNTYKPSIKNMDEEMANACVFSYPPNSNAIDTSSPSKQVEDDGIRRLSFGSASELPMHDELNGEEGLNVVSGMDQFISSSLIKQDAGDEKVETVRSNIELSNDSLAGTEKGSLFGIALPSNSHIDISEPPMKDAVSVSAQQVEESPMTLHKKNAKKLKVKKQLNIEATTGQCNVLGENQMALKLGDKERKKKKSKFQHRQSLAGAGTLWRSGVRRSTRIRSRPLEYWRGERFLYGRIHNSLSTVIGIKYSSPLPAQQKKNIVPQFKVQSYVDEQYSDLVNFAALH